jgi:hypothetical protein
MDAEAAAYSVVDHGLFPAEIPGEASSNILLENGLSQVAAENGNMPGMEGSEDVFEAYPGAESEQAYLCWRCDKSFSVSLVTFHGMELLFSIWLFLVPTDRSSMHLGRTKRSMKTRVVSTVRDVADRTWYDMPALSYLLTYPVCSEYASLGSASSESPRALS